MNEALSPTVDDPSVDDPAADGSAAAARPEAQPLLDRTDRAILVALALGFLAIRGAVFPFAENLHGDAIVRAELAERWAAEPKLIRHFHDGAYQFGPLHFYTMGAALELWPSREHATRLTSLLLGVLLVLPAYRIGRRLFSRRAAVVSALALGVWALHVQASTTAASEALALTLLFFAVDWLFEALDSGRLGPLALSAVAANLLCATRYDGWMYLPLLALVAAAWGKDRIAAATRAVVFALLCLPFPLWWMQQNEKATGDALYPIHYIDTFHAAWVGDGVAQFTEAGFRLMSLFFWPGALVATTSLFVGLFALVGLAVAFRRRQNRALALLSVAPAAYFAIRGGVLLDFSPLARFTMPQVALAMLFVSDGFDACAARLSSGGRRGLAMLAAVVAVATPLALGAATAWRTGKVADALSPIGPISTLPVDQRACADFVSSHIAPNESFIVDDDPRYKDLHVAHYTGLPEERLLRRRWENFEEKLPLAAAANWMLTIRGGRFEKQEGVAAGEAVIQWRGRTFERALAPSANLTLYRAR